VLEQGTVETRERDARSRPRARRSCLSSTGLAHLSAQQRAAVTPAGFERYFARMAAERQGIEPPEWARQPVPEVTTVGPPIDRETK
jgi:hypothetical protein